MSTGYIGYLQMIIAGYEETNATQMYNVTTCVTKVEHYTFYKYIIIPACIIILLFSFLEKRKRLCVGVFGSQPGCVYPMDVLTRSSRMSYACAFGITVLLLYRIIFEQQYAINYSGPVYMNTLVAIASVIIYGVTFYPIFACLSVGSMFSYGVGSLYVWMFTILEFYKAFECQLHLNIQLIVVARDLPIMLCWLYLSISIPGRFVISARRQMYFHGPKEHLEKVATLEDIRDSYLGDAVKRLLVRPQPPIEPTGMSAKIRNTVKNLFQQWIYHRQKDFVYSSRFLSVMFVSGLIIYIITFELIPTLYPILDIILRSTLYGLGQTYGYYPEEGEPQWLTNKREGVYLIYYLIRTVQICIVVSTALAALTGFLMILHMLSSYRRNLQALYRGDFSHIPEADVRTNTSHMVGFVRYAGYQVGYAAWAYVIQLAMYFIVTTALATGISLLIAGISDWLVFRLLRYWPVVFIALVLAITQILLTKCFFVQNRGEILAMDNRRALFVFAYFMFFFNVFLGIVSCLLRMLKSIALGALLIGRLDHSSLSRSFQFFDPGFAAYVGFLHVENAHTHPCVIVFVRLMQMNLKRDSVTMNIEDGVNMKLGKKLQYRDQWLPNTTRNDVTAIPGDLELQRRRRMGARFSWHIAYTLLNNPSVRFYRKGYLQHLNKALKEGKRRKVTDNLFDDLNALDMERDATSSNGRSNASFHVKL